ncbi:MAG: hypothetical protein OEZ43_05705 [Gammaproteobacteria bacterium]|nr:hypothetical protein [Gammaproteobacteria bacterium]
MTKKTTARLGKFITPVINSEYERISLYEKLDDKQSSKAIWLSGAAGTGKTSVVSSYIRKRKKPYLWFQMDKSDQSLASFVRSLSACIENSFFSNGKTLPKFTAEYHRGVEAFGRQYARELCKGLSKPVHIIFDDFHIVGESFPLIEFINALLEEISSSVRLIIVSRQPPPQKIAAKSVYSDLAHISGQELYLSQAEVSDFICKAIPNQDISEEVLDTMMSLSKGWIAALVLLVRQLHSGHSLCAIESLLDQELLAFFSQQVITDLTETEKSTLMKLSFLPGFTLGNATQICGDSTPAAIINRLIGNNYFIQIKEGKIRHHVFHPLFKNYLRDEAEVYFNVEEKNEIRRRAANILVNAGQLDEAIGYFCELNAWNEIAKIIQRVGEQFIANGQHQQLVDWCDKIPADILSELAWPMYWYGIALQTSKPLLGKSYLTKAYSVFKEKGDTDGMYHTWPAIIENITSVWDDFHPLNYWLDELAELEQKKKKIPGLELKAKIFGFKVMALGYARPHDEILHQAIKKLELLFRLIPIPKFRALLGAQLMWIYSWQGENNKMAAMSHTLQACLNMDSVPTLHKIVLSALMAQVDWAQMSLETKHIDRCKTLSDEHGVHVLDFLVNCQEVYTFAAYNEIVKARDALRSLEQKINYEHKGELGHFQYLSAWLSFLEGDNALASELLASADELNGHLGSPFGSALVKTIRAQIYAEQGQHALAVSTINATESLAQAMRSRGLLYMCYLTRAWIAKNEGDMGQCLLYIEKSFSLGSAINAFCFPLFRRDVVYDLVTIAIQNNIQATYTRVLIKRHRFTPSVETSHLSGWPWRIKIHTLGRFELIVNDEPYSPGRKSQKRVMDLLKSLLIADGRPRTIESISQFLWPDLDGDAARKACLTALYRLRQIMGVDSIIQTEGLIHINRDIVWVDTRTLEKQCNNIVRTQEISLLQLDEDTKQLFEIYQGDFLNGDETDAKIISRREHLKDTYIRALLTLAERFYQIGQFEKALSIYQHGSRSGIFDERFYTGKMRCLYKLGRPSEAIYTYRKCREIFSQTLGVSPSDDMEALRQRIQNSSRIKEG